LNKYQIKCVHCGTVTPSFALWFLQNQCCPNCKSKHAEVEYDTDYATLPSLLTGKPESFWHYFDFLPLLDKAHIVTCKEGAIPVENWEFLDKYAHDNFQVDCRVMVYRNDLNGGTNTFKDVAASLAASIFKETAIHNFCVASTGNTATAFSKYLSLAGVKFTVFVPACVSADSVEEMRSWGQEVVIADGDYAYAKKMAAEYAIDNAVLISAGNIDPIRVEAKRTMVFEFLRQMGSMPDIYIQAVSGGTGPIAIDKGVREIQNFFPEVTLPRMLLVQQDLCDPMVSAWENAQKNGFPDGYEKIYPVIDNPQTTVSILSTGNPGMFPVIAPIVKKSNGTFLRINESELVDFARIVQHEKGIILGPASMVCLAGFYQALKERQIHNGETVLVNIGEGAVRSKEFASKL